jgi:hypothetical protein
MQKNPGKSKTYDTDSPTIRASKLYEDGRRHEISKGRQIENDVIAISHNKCLRGVIHHSVSSVLHILMTTYKTHVQTVNTALNDSV